MLGTFAALSLVASARLLVAQEAALLISPGKLSRAHSDLSDLNSCGKCHTAGTKSVEGKCLACHKDLAGRIAAGRGFHKDKKDGCASCHPDHQGADFALIEWNPQTFDHAKTGSPLEGKHASVRECRKCHNARTAPPTKTTVSYLIKDTCCSACHQDTHKGQFGARDCSACHSLDRPLKEPLFDHSQAAYRPQGAHRNLACEKCHPVKKWKGLKFGSCADCHKDPHQPSFGTTCAKCHGETAWKTGTPDHSKSKFPLKGKHAALKCAQCHKNGKLDKIPGGSCRVCHTADPHRGQFEADCASCHDDKTFKKATTDHKKSRYPLTGKHVSVACAKCHKTEGGTNIVRYRPLGTACADCHQDVHLRQFTKTCETCHSTAGFSRAFSSFDHQRDSSYRLDGAHAARKCEECHKKESRPAAGGPAEVVRYRPLSNECASCHQDEHGGQLGRDCAKCHDTVHFKPAPGFSHEKSGYSLKGFHEATACDKCHPRIAAGVSGRSGPPARYKPTATKCAECHRASDHAKTDYPLTGRHAVVDCAACHTAKTPRLKRLRTAGAPPPGQQDCRSCHADPHEGALKNACASCHTTSGWTSTAVSFHQKTDFPLTGRHISVPCASCHLAGVVKGTPKDCFICHWMRREDDRYRTRLGTRCEECHKTTTWMGVRWDHGARTGLPLNGRHAALGCESCHKNGTFVGTSSDCYSCHQQDYTETRNPPHASAGFPTVCQICHNPADAAFSQGKFDHNTSYPLVGIHAGQACAACHKNNLYRGTSRDCYGCHRADYERTKQPVHTAAGFPTACEICHKPTDPGWDRAIFNHSTSYPLVGVHATQSCDACHKNAVYRGTPSDCYGCHRTEYDRAQNPAHDAAGFPTSCETCHRATDAAWTQGSFNHASTYALAGVHSTQPCAACHTGGIYKGTTRDCYGCHRTSYDQTRNPPHATSGFSTACDTCHRAADAAWTQGSFNHASTYALVGVHSTQPCAACHINGIYKGTPRDCYGCHRTSYDQTRNPNHAASGFSTACETCHRATDAAWTQATFNHGSTYTLVGVHATQPCAGCHVNGIFKGTPRDCYGCHRTSYDQTRNPNHAASGYSTACDTCHRATDATWTQATFNHGSTFALVGVHATQPCAGCHVNGIYKGTPRDCYGCHRTSYDQTRNPNHAASGFSTACDTCHRATDTLWTQGTFNHSSTFALVGIHATQPCAACHVNGIYKGTPRDCYGCHRTSYDQTRNPPHAASGFSTACVTCHRATDSSWAQGTFNHTAFPISSGRHAGNACSACHTDATNYRVFTCLTCHSRSSTDSNHRTVSGYVYNSANCYACHPRG